MKMFWTAVLMSYFLAGDVSAQGIYEQLGVKPTVQKMPAADAMQSANVTVKSGQAKSGTESKGSPKHDKKSVQERKQAIREMYQHHFPRPMTFKQAKELEKKIKAGKVPPPKKLPAERQPGSLLF
jgi:hypothetical protein